MNPFATTAATARGCQYKLRAPRVHPMTTYLSCNYYNNFLSFVAKDGVHKLKQHLLFHRGSDAGRLLQGRTSTLIAGGTLVVNRKSPIPTTGIIRIASHAYL